jgi:hypothetical protein
MNATWFVFTWRDAYRLTNTYQPGDVCTYLGCSYVALAITTGVLPPSDPASWGLLAQPGQQGPAGQTGPRGQIGLTGAIGSTGPDGPQGIQGEPGPGALYFAGVWDASLNSPTITNGHGFLGQFYKVGTAGNTVIDGNTSWHAGDWAIFDGVTWDKVDNYEAVLSVAGRVGAVVLAASDIASGTLAAARLPSQVNIPLGVGAAPTASQGLVVAALPASGAAATGLIVAAPTGATANYAASFSGGNVGIGTATPGQALEVNGNVFSNASGAGSALLGQVASYPGIWFGANTASPSVTNYSFLYSLGTVLNAPTGASIWLRINNVTYGQLNTNGLAINYGTNPCPAGVGLIVNTGKVGFGTASPTSALQVVGLPIYANNAAAIGGGLTAGAFYRTGGDPDQVCIVH